MAQLTTRPIPRRQRKETPSGEEVFKAILSEDIEWKPFAAFSPSAPLAVIVGQPSEPGPYMIRVKVPHGVKLMPDRHPEDRIYTVISGVRRMTAVSPGTTAERCAAECAVRLEPMCANTGFSLLGQSASVRARLWASG